jgi:hypothetical protein
VSSELENQVNFHRLSEKWQKFQLSEAVFVGTEKYNSAEKLIMFASTTQTYIERTLNNNDSTSPTPTYQR